MSHADTLSGMTSEQAGANARKRTPEAAAFAAQLRAERAAIGMSQEELAEVSGVSHSAIARIETGVRVMDTAQLGAFCKALGISLATFAIRADERMRADDEAPARARRRGA